VQSNRTTESLLCTVVIIKDLRKALRDRQNVIWSLVAGTSVLARGLDDATI
jgi:hypothetical protein